jgi:hypothetical protein
MAMNIISKEKKEIKWIGLPCNKKQECQELQIEKREKEKRIQEKSDILRNLILEYVATKALIERNQAKSETASTKDRDSERITSKIDLPFVLFSTDSKTVVDCCISHDKKEYTIQFDNTFQMSTHLDVLRKLGQANCKENQDDATTTAKACAMLPKSFKAYVQQMLTSNGFQPVYIDSDLPDYNNLIKSETSQNNKILRPAKRTGHKGSVDVDETEPLFNEDDCEKLSTKYGVGFETGLNEKNLHDNDEKSEVVISDDEEIYYENDFEDEEEDDDDDDDEDSIAESMSQ